jgi:hypothetical protein
MRFFAPVIAALLSGGFCFAANPVAPDKLFAFLPEPPEGWFAESPTGAGTEGGQLPVTVAGRNYFKTAPENAAAAPAAAPVTEAPPAPPPAPAESQPPSASPSPASGGETAVEAPEKDVPSASVNIADAPDNPEFFESATGGWEPVDESESGYARRIEVGGNRGFETFDKERGVTSAVVVVRDRFLVTVEVVGLDPKELRAWLDRINLSGLAQFR